MTTNTFWLRSRWRVNHAKQVALAASLLSVLGLTLLGRSYAATPDESVAVMAVFLTAFYVIFRLTIAIIVARVPMQSRAEPKRTPVGVTPIAVALMLAIIVLYCAMALLVTTAVLPLADLRQFCGPAFESALWSVALSIGFVAFAAAYSVAWIAWLHRWSIIGEAQRILRSVKAAIRADMDSHWAPHH